MLEESQCPPESRYVSIIGRYSATANTSTLHAVQRYFDKERNRFDEAATATTEQFLAFAASFHGIVLQTIYCHADVPQGRFYDMVIDMQNPERFELTHAIVHYNVIWGQTVTPGLVHGWHQAAYFEFPKGVPQLITSLPVDRFEARPLVGLCDAVNWEAIALDILDAN